MNPLFAIVGSALAGVIASTAFAPWDFPGAMVVAVAGWCWLLRRMAASRVLTVLIAGFAFGWGYMGPLIWWMNAVDPAAWIALVMAQAVFYVLIAWALRAVLRLPGWPLWMAAVWTAGESLRGAIPLSGFPWGRLAHTAIDTPVESLVRLVGMPATTFVLALVAALFVLAAERPRRIVPVAGATGAVLLCGALLPVGLAGAGESHRVAVVQGGTPGPFLQWPRGEIFELHLEATAGIDEPVDMVLWPENAMDIDPLTEAWAGDRLTEASRDVGAPILAAGILNGPTSTTAYNAGFVWTPRGHQETYVKRKLVPYGEYVPLRQQLGDLVPRIDRDIPRDMLAGDEPGDLRIGGAVIGDTICWDIAYDGIVREAIGGGAEFLVVQTSNASFEGTSQLRQQWNISRLRAIETGRYVVVPSTNGISGVVAPDGEVVTEAPLLEPTVMIEDITGATGTTPAQRLAAPLEGLIAGLALVGVVAAWRAARRRG
ncbi:apolipoprotein N-acyltransferase [Aeromicrobium sp. YIM 150415]|uniref:apolipoprotein N-acyltransferase n=1 Tax=Aeromicrobium sp. YIM 150415 TaxID=2803912 RepID=UPI0019660F56|nr:apolipoprotein N-acyltransferase [Aeromicrobium sp. YIM 150415]MBM9462517.1 apolipoprotein N-acyltransferase [Aeromicrobium sp. YIM 150415]